MSRMLIVSNRLPVTVRAEHGELRVTRSTGGLATALRGVHSQRESLWIGWPGDTARLSALPRQKIDAELAGMRAAPVYLDADEHHRFYDGFSNGVLWPLFHYLLDKVNLDAQPDWEAYRSVNERFAAVVSDHYRAGDTIWIHDYQLMLLPALLRRRFPAAKIGFFLHTPFPSAEVFRILPWREQILEGLLGADLVGFHTASYRLRFLAAAARVLGLDPGEDALEHEGRTVALGVHPISVDVGEIERLTSDPEVRAEAERIRAEARGRKIVLGIDRLDYTKGIPRRLLAIERFLEREPELRYQVRFLQLAVPTREEVSAYADYRSVVHEMVGRINGRYGSVDETPIHYLNRSLPFEQVVALYLAADVMLVTPLRDGMNLVAKEFVATRVNDDGVLVLSEFAGAAVELETALIVNPYDIEAVASTISRALRLPADERRARMVRLRQRVHEYDVHAWAREFVGHLSRTPDDSATPRAARSGVMAES
jgi:trehalose 6-phosphate synthase/phosphatase